MPEMTLAARSRRADILAAAQREFASAGYAGGRIERIAASADVNKQLLFHYFESKEGLFRSALDALLLRYEPTPAGPSDQPADDIRRVLSDLQSAVRAIPGVLGIIADSTANEGFPPDAAAAVHAWRDRMIERLESAVTDGQRRGYFRDDVDPGTVAGLALAAVLGTAALGESGSSIQVGLLLVDYCAWR